MRPFTSCAAVAVVLLASSLEARADTLRVPSDDHPTIQSAVDAAVTGDVILIARGTYLETVTIDGKSGISIRGRGFPTIDGEDTRDVLLIQNSSDILVRGITSARSRDKGIEVLSSQDVTISRCRIRDAGGDGVGTESVSRVTIERNVISDVGSDGIDMSAGSGALTSDDCTVTRNRILRCDDDGLDVNGSNNEIVGNRIIEPGETGCEEDNDSGTNTGNLWERNLVVDGGEPFLRIRGSGGVWRRNRGVRGGEQGIHVESTGTGNTIEKNVIRDTALSGALVEGSNNDFSKNRCIRPVTTGITVTGSGNTFLKDRVSKAGGIAGVHLPAFATGNRLERVGISRSLGIGLLIEGTGNTVASSKASRSGSLDLQDDSSGGTTYEGRNRFKNSNLP